MRRSLARPGNSIDHQQGPGGERLTRQVGDTMCGVTMRPDHAGRPWPNRPPLGLGSVRCKDLVRLILGLGFAVRDGRKAGHKVTHPTLVNLTSASFTCGHGRNQQVKPIVWRRSDGSWRHTLAVWRNGRRKIDDDNGESLRLQHHGARDRL